MMRTNILLVGALASLAVSAADVRQVFREPRLTRGDTNVRRVQPIDDAAWIWADVPPQWGVATDGDAWRTKVTASSCPFFRFRRRFVADGAPLRLDVSADERFVLFLDGRPVARGPHRGLVMHWYYQTYEITGLAPGEHVLEAVCWQLGRHAPLAQLSYRGGFVLKAEGAYDAQLTTGKAAWEVGALANTRMTDIGTSRTFGVGSQCEIDGTSFVNERPARWAAATVVRPPLAPSPCGGRAPGWMLFPTERPDVTYAAKTPGRVVNAAADLTRPLVVPAHAERDFWWDLGDYYCAYPELETAGGRGAVVTWGWTESLRDADGRKGDRAAWRGKSFSQTLTDTFRCDGRPGAFFTTPWWRCGRWCRLTVKTADEPLEIRRVAVGETGYPLAADAAFSCDDGELADVVAICRRSLAACLHEMPVDCPYYEQQMYPGDTRIQLQILNALTRDARLNRFAMSVFDFDRRDNGMVAMNFPTRATQESATYTLCWTLMFGDYLLWHDDPAFLRARLPGARHALMGMARYENADGLLEDLPGWSFMDWMPRGSAFAKRWRMGTAPCGSPGQGVSALNNLLYLHALRSVAAVDEALGERHLAAHGRAKAERLGRTLVARFWDETRGLLADTAAKDAFSEHAQSLAILGGILSDGQRRRAFEGLLSAPDLAPASSYFAYYLFSAYASEGRADLIRRRLDTWKNFVRHGAKTAFETQEVEARSDCHAWSACPLHFLQTAFAGVTPAAPFFRRVRVAPQPAGLAFIRAKTPCPQGLVETDFAFDADGGVTGSVRLPGTLQGEFVWRGQAMPLKPGDNRIQLTTIDKDKGKQDK